MWEIKRLKALALAAICAASVLLPSCASSESVGEAMIQPVESKTTGSNVKLADVTVGSVYRIYSADGRVSYKDQTIVCGLDGARIEEYGVSAGDAVSKGDLIVSFSVDYSAAERQSLEAELTIAKNSAERQKRSAADAVKAAKDSLGAASGADSYTARRLRLALERAEINEKLAKSAADKSVASAQKVLDDFDARIADAAIYAPADGYVANVEYRQPGTAVPRGGKICTLVLYDDVSLSGTSDLGGAVRYGMTATVSAKTIVNEPFETKVIAAPNITGEVTGDFAVEIPADVLATIGEAADRASNTAQYRPGGSNNNNRGGQQSRLPSNIRIEVERYRIDGVTIVPNDAIGTEDGRRFVYVLRDGELRKRFISVGVTDEKNAQVLDGLEPGERVSVG